MDAGSVTLLGIYRLIHWYGKYYIDLERKLELSNHVLQIFNRPAIIIEITHRYEFNLFDLLANYTRNYCYYTTYQ